MSLRSNRLRVGPNPYALHVIRRSSTQSAARLISGFGQTDHISQYMREVLHWLPFPQRISYRIASLVWRCLSGWAPSYLRELCRPLSSCTGRRALRSSVHGDLAVPFARSATMQSRSFSVVGPTTWNGLPLDLRHLPNCSQFHQLLKTAFSAWPGSGAPLSRDLEGALYKF